MTGVRMLVMTGIMIIIATIIGVQRQCLLRCGSSDAIGDGDAHAGIVAGRGDGVVKKIVESSPVGDDEVGAADANTIAGGEAKGVNIRTGGDDRGDLYGVAADIAREVGQNGGGGHHAKRRARPLRRRSVASASGDRDGSDNAKRQQPEASHARSALFSSCIDSYFTFNACHVLSLLV